MEADSIHLSNDTVARDPAVLTATPAPIAEPSPFADPDYGRDAEHGSHVIHSNPTWKLGETQSSLTGLAAASYILISLLWLAWQRTAPQLPKSLLEALPGNLQFVLPQVIANLWENRHIVLIAGLAVLMLGIEMLYFKVQRRHFDFFSPRTVDSAAWGRIYERLVAISACLILAFTLYFLLGEYRFRWPYPDGFYYKKYHTFFTYLLILLPVLCVPYFYLVEKFARHNGPVDEFLITTRCINRMWRGIWSKAHRADGWSALKNGHVHNLLRGMAVKFFFIPLMMLWSIAQYGVAERFLQDFFYHTNDIVWLDPNHTAFMLRGLLTTGLMVLFTLDLTPALIGYIASMRLLDTQVTTAEPTLFGWMVALMCYPPFNVHITGAYFLGARHESWRVFLVDDPVLSTLALIFIFVLMAIYTWATLAFGIRFSNLTNRGIINCGPYKYVRHPAYICKTSSWWIEALPFLAYSWTALATYVFTQIVTTGIYALRAWTEERHLMREPHYQEYCKQVPYRFIPGVF